MGDQDEDADDEGIDGVPDVEAGERIGAEREKDFVRNLGDPKLPSPKEVEDHRLRGHIPYSNSCRFALRLWVEKEVTLGIRKVREYTRSIVGIIAFLGMS